MEKPISIIKGKNSALLCFDHGLGDFINFLPIYFELQKQANKKIAIGSPSKRQFNLIYSNTILLDQENINFRSKYDYIYKIHYPDSTDSNIPIEYHIESAKPFLCAYYELGLKPFDWKPFLITNKWKDVNSRRIGVNLFGHTGMRTKFCPNETALKIWDEIIEAGYEPFEVHMKPQFAHEYNLQDRGIDYFPIANRKNSLRFEIPDLQRMMEEIGKCKYFIGIDSGPIYLAASILGHENVIGLTNKKKHYHFMPQHISSSCVYPYKEKDIYNKIIQRDKWI